MIVVALTILVLIPCLVGLQESTLKYLSRSLASGKSPRTETAKSVLGIILLHTVEVIAFGIAFHLLVNLAGIGELSGNFHGELKDCIYYSFVNFTTLGSGELTPYGPIRFLTGIEALTGFVFITWSASFLYKQTTYTSES
jgi:hypothetical protein